MFVVALFFAAAVDVERTEIGPLRIEIVKPAREIGLDDPVVLQLTIQHPPNVEIERPALRVGDTLDSARVTAVGVEGPDRIDGPFGVIVVANWTITLQPTKVGKLSLPKVKTRYREKEKSAVEAEISLPSFEVFPGTRLATTNEPVKLPPLQPLEDRSRLAWWMKAVGGVALVLCLAGLAWHGVRSNSTKADGKS
jgi:hypothetical protein